MNRPNDTDRTRPGSRAARSALRALGLAIFLLGLLAPPALAAPSWGITLSNSRSELPRNYDRMDYTAVVTNTGDAPTSGPITITVELPGGASVFKIVTQFNASCVSQAPSGIEHAKVTCVGHDPLAAGSGEAVKVVARLGPSAEEPTGTAVATVSGGGAASPAGDTAQYTFTEAIPFGPLPGSFEAGVFDSAGNSYNKAGGHPFRTFTTFGFNMREYVGNAGPQEDYLPAEFVRDVVVDAPRGFVGNALTTPAFCPGIEEVLLGLCPLDSVVGGTDIYAVLLGGNSYVEKLILDASAKRPIYSLEPEFGRPAQFAFGVPVFGGVPYTFVPELRADEGYAISFRTAPVALSPPLAGADVHLCSFGVNMLPGVFDGALGAATGPRFGSCKEATDPDAYPDPLVTNPTRCSGPPPSTVLKVDSWEHPADVRTAEDTAEAIEECEEVPFEPEGELIPTNRQADTPTGLDVEFNLSTDGLLSNTGVAQANLDNITVTLPKGMSINAASAEGLGACSLAQVRMGSNAAAECPESSRVGSIEIDTPLIRETLSGSIYVAQQNNNPFKAPLGLYMVFSSARDGITVKVAGKLTPDPVTGQLVSSFVENPEWPFSRLQLHFNQGPRSPLVNPPKCGTYEIRTEFSPWTAVNPANPTPDEIVTDDSTYEVTSGPNGSPCPSGVLDPKLKAGVQNAQAGSKSPFVFSLSREDGTQRFNKIDVTTPRGLTAYLKGVPYCSDAVLAGISGAEETGRPELAGSSCPPASQVGTSQAGAGSGPLPFYAPGKVYLAGPYKGAPVSLAVVTPAVAGPYDLGNVVVRNPLYVDPVTSQVKTESDPIPTIKHGIVLNVRDIRVSLDRPNFTKAPTNCSPMSVDAHVSGLEGGDATTSNRFQVGGCEKLSFKPKLGFRLFGGTKRGSHPKLRATVTMPEGGANIASASVALPHSAFLDQAHIKTVCTRVQYAADQCPPGSIYGEAEATTPLLDHPVKGPAYLRSSNNQLPDLVLALRGPDSQPIEIDLVGKIDSVHGGIRTTFETIPDQPVSTFTLNMQGGKKGLLVNSRNICAGKQKATAVFTAQNGLSTKLRPVMKNSCAKTRKKAKQAKQQRAAKRRSSH